MSPYSRPCVRRLVAAATLLFAPGCPSSGDPGATDSPGSSGDAGTGSTDEPGGASGTSETPVTSSTSGTSGGLTEAPTGTGDDEPETGASTGDGTGLPPGDGCVLEDDDHACAGLVADGGRTRVAAGPTAMLRFAGAWTAPPAPAPVQACDVYAQDCPEGQKCNPYATDGGPLWNATGCFPLDPGAGKPGDACSMTGTQGPDTCEAGAFCMFDPSGGGMLCERLCGCAESDPTCGGGEKCMVFNNGAIPLCMAPCDPLDPAACIAGEVCVSEGVPPDFACRFDASGDQGGAGDPCSVVNGCDVGHMCVNSSYVPGGCGGAGACCTALCDLDAPACGGGLDCLPFYDGEAPTCLEDVGICLKVGGGGAPVGGEYSDG